MYTSRYLTLSDCCKILVCQFYAPINVKPLGGGGGRPGIGGEFDVTSLPVVRTFDHSLSSGGSGLLTLTVRKSEVH